MVLGILRKFLAFALSVFYLFHSPIVPAKDSKPIEPDADSRLNLICWADPQVSDYILKRDPYFIAACEDVRASKTVFDAMLIAGDVTENGRLVEYDYIASKLPTENFRNFILAAGNHEVRSRSYSATVKRFTSFANGLNKTVNSGLIIDALHYKYVLNGYTFIVLGTDRTEAETSYLSPAQLKWLDDALEEASADGLPVFVTVHQPLKDTHGLPDTWDGPFGLAGSVGDQSDQLRDILAKYKNVILLTGHLHTGFGAYTYERAHGIHSVSLPSLTIDNKDGKDDGNGSGLGFWVEVFEDRVVFHARNFAERTDVPNEDFVIRLEK